MIEQDGDGIVPLIESGKLDTSEMKTLLESYINPMIERNIDHLVLGCTHYPYLIPILREILPENVNIIDSGLAVARQTKAVLAKENSLNSSDEEGTVDLFTNGNIAILNSLLDPKFGTSSLEF